MSSMSLCQVVIIHVLRSLVKNTTPRALTKRSREHDAGAALLSRSIRLLQRLVLELLTGVAAVGRLPLRSLYVVPEHVPRLRQHAVASADAPSGQLPPLHPSRAADAPSFGRLAHVLPFAGDAERLGHRRAVRRLPAPTHGAAGRLAAGSGGVPRPMQSSLLGMRAQP